MYSRVHIYFQIRVIKTMPPIRAKVENLCQQPSYKIGVQKLGFSALMLMHYTYYTHVGPSLLHIHSLGKGTDGNLVAPNTCCAMNDTHLSLTQMSCVLCHDR